MSLTIFPVRDRILVQVIEPPLVTTGGIVLPSGPTNGLVRGTVIEVGEGPALGSKPIPVKPNDIVHFPAQAGVEVEINGVRLRVVAYEQVFMYEHRSEEVSGGERNS